jgi:glucosylceramidase
MDTPHTAQAQTRRDFVKLTATALAATALPIAAPAAEQESARGSGPSGEITVRLTDGANRFAAQPPLRWRPAERSSSAPRIVFTSGETYQELLGFGAAFTDASCYLFDQLPATARQRLFRELFHPSEMALSVCRICVGSSDYSKSMYSYDEGDPDPELQRFSIDQDREYILPMLRQAREMNPGLFLLASPWSPPGWMKPNGSMLGGSMRKKYFSAYTKYLTAFLHAYAAAGVPVNAITTQNEVDTDQDGRMPACLWGQEYEIEFIARHLGPQFAREGIATKIWALDHNYNLWGRAICELDEPEVNRYVDGVAWHGYAGTADAMTRVHNAYPEKHGYWTEGGPDYKDPNYLTDWAKWSSTFTDILRNWSRCIIGWNLALDEKGKPNIGPFDCGGVITIHSSTQEITRSGQYWAFAHYARALRRGAKRFNSNAENTDVRHLAFRNPNGTNVAVLTNAGKSAAVTLSMNGMTADVALPESSVATLVWR